MAATPQSIFTAVSLPNATTWFYFSALLAVALFFKFTRLLSVRNLDVLTLFLPMPGLLLLLEGGGQVLWGYVWLLGASGYFLARCLVDLALVRRPALTPNLNLSGLVWLSGALFISLVAVAVRQPEDDRQTRDSGSVAASPEQPETPKQAEGAPWQLWVERGLTLLCHLAVAVGMVLIGWKHFDDIHAGMAAATFYLLLPYTYLLLPETELGIGRWDHSFSGALLVWAVMTYRWPLLSGSFLGLCAGILFFPVFTFPIWISFYWRRGALRFGLAFLLLALVGLGVVAAIIHFNGKPPRSLQAVWARSDYLPGKPPKPLTTTPDHFSLPEGSDSLWQSIPGHWVYRMPIFLAYLAFISTTAFWPAPKNLAHVLALSAAALIGIQLWYADQGGVYVLWYLPFLLLLVFRPNLSTCQPAPLGNDRLSRLGRRLRIVLRRLLRLPRRHATSGVGVPKSAS